MRNKAVPMVLVLLACACWASLVLFVNRKPPDSTNQVIFLLMLGTAVATTFMPLSYAVSARLAGPYGAYGLFGRATRQGLFAGVLAVALMLLRFMQLLTPLNAIALTVAVVMIEVLICLRNR
ncbi:MAG: hypothetical protein ACYC4R_01530 [Anaerolineae bacterium]